MVSEVEPEATLDRTYAKWVLELEGAMLNRWTPTRKPAITITPACDRVISDIQEAWEPTNHDGQA
jgi:hypothetical protein